MGVPIGALGVTVTVAAVVSAVVKYAIHNAPALAATTRAAQRPDAIYCLSLRKVKIEIIAPVAHMTKPEAKGKAARWHG